MDEYTKIYQTLLERVDRNEITYEFAEKVNELAYNKYIREGFLFKKKDKKSKEKEEKPKSLDELNAKMKERQEKLDSQLNKLNTTANKFSCAANNKVGAVPKKILTA